MKNFSVYGITAIDKNLELLKEDFIILWEGTQQAAFKKAYVLQSNMTSGHVIYVAKYKMLLPDRKHEAVLNMKLFGQTTEFVFVKCILRLLGQQPIEKVA